MEVNSILIEHTTREEREKMVADTIRGDDYGSKVYFN